MLITNNKYDNQYLNISIKSNFYYFSGSKLSFLWLKIQLYCYSKYQKWLAEDLINAL
jgi:hypothetical protein